METYYRGETPKLFAVFKTQTISDDGVVSDSSLDDPDTSIKIIIEDNTGDVVQALTNMDKDSTGKYSYSGYTIPVTANCGIWKYECRGTDATKVCTGRGSFEVKEEVV